MERIIVENVSKKFKIGFKKRQNALESFVSFFSGKEPKKEMWALTNVSFKANSAEIIGIIGENGSGKSTLLRTIAGIYKQDNGKIKTNGKIISLINLNVGMQHRLTMKDNIYLCCTLFNLSKKEIKKKFNPIVKFSELEKFIDTKLYQFSNGMLQRLTFSIAIHSNPDILLLDEVFEIGDENFRKKSVEKIKDLVNNGVAVILVSHHLRMIERYCKRVIWLEQGKIKKEGKAREVVKEYQNET